MQFSPREAAGGAERRVCSPWAPSSLGAGFLPPELHFNRAGPARRRLLRIQLHHFYLGADPRPLLQFLRWMGLHLQGHCWGVRSITVLLEATVHQSNGQLSQFHTGCLSLLNARSRLASEVFHLLE